MSGPTGAGGVPRFPGFPAAYDPVRWWARQAGERIALVEWMRSRRLSYAELDLESDRWSAALAALGVRPGDRVGMLAANRAECVALFYGCVRLGAALVPLNWRLAAPELAAVLADAGCVAIVGDGARRALAEEAMRVAGRLAGRDARWVDLDADAPRLLSRAGDAPPAVATDAEGAAMVLYTSGSTGRPKGAVLPHRMIHFNAVATTVGWELSSSDVAPVTTPFFHTGGWHVFLTPLLHVGGRVVLLEQFEAATFLDAMEREGCTVGFGVPTQLVMLLERAEWGRPLPRMRWMISGGAPCPPAVAARVREAGYGFKEGFGLTECGPNCFAITPEEAERRPGTVGRPVPGLEMRLVSDAGEDVRDGEAGELVLRGPQMFGGYLHDAERTAEALLPGGWLRTGDLVRRDADGLHYVCGRRKEMYISGGENVFPGEVEAALADCPGLAEVAVVGVPDERWGEVGCAFVVPSAVPGVAGGAARALTPDAVLAHARGRLGKYKVPKRVVLLDAMPRLGSGKADRRLLVELATGGAPAASTTVTAG